MKNESEPHNQVDAAGPNPAPSDPSKLQKLTSPSSTMTATIQFQQIPIGQFFEFRGRRYKKLALSMASDEDRYGSIFMAETEVLPDPFPSGQFAFGGRLPPCPTGARTMNLGEPAGEELGRSLGARKSDRCNGVLNGRTTQAFCYGKDPGNVTDSLDRRRQDIGILTCKGLSNSMR